MLAPLALAHAILALVLLASRGLADRERSGLVRVTAAGGMAAAAILFLFRGADSAWGAQQLAPQSGAVASVAVFCAWLLVAALDRGEGRWDVGALVGAASTALVLFATTLWVAPALMFWVVVSGAALVAGWHSTGKGFAWVAVGLSDVCVVGGLVTHSVLEESWRMPDQVPPWLTAVLVTGVVLRVGVLPRVGVWGLLGGAEAAVLPLLVGAGFALVPAASGGDDIAVALGLLAAGLASAAWCVAARGLRQSVVAAWVSAVILSVVWIEPRALGRAGATAALAVAAVALWPWTSGRAQSERALLLGAVPATIGFGVILAGAAAAFDRVTDAGSVTEAAPWFAFAALLPAALAGGVTLGAASARRVEPETYEPTAVLAMWTLAVFALVLGLSPAAELGFGSIGTRSPVLYLVAAASGLVAARWGPRQVAALTPGETPRVGVFSLPGAPGRWLAAGAALLALLALAATLWFTYIGLRAGFL